MKKISSIVLSVMLVFSLLLATNVVMAQTYTTMPTLYNQSGVAVNTTSGVSLPAGWYYLQPNAQASSQVYYYGNGTFYNANTMLYGGSVGNPTGLAGVSLNYVNPVVTPGVPNTGEGGLAMYSWVLLLASATVVIAGILYLRKQYSPVPKNI